jgi:hypothetical protein
VIRTLRDAKSLEIEPSMVHEAELDVQAVLREYLRSERDINDKARAMSDAGRGSYSSLKQRLAFNAKLKTGEEALDYVIDQMIETFLQSNHIEEIFADDLELRRVIAKILRKHTAETEATLDREVRDRIKNLQEGSVAWDAEYERVMKQMRREKKL